MIVMGVLPAVAQTQVDGTSVPPVPDKPGTGTVNDSPAGAPDAYGVENYTAFVVPPTSFHPYNEGLGYIFWAGGYIGAQTTDTWRYFEAPVYLPTGALLSSTVISYYDNDDPGYVSIGFYLQECPAGSACTQTTLVGVQSEATGTPGYSNFNDGGSNGVTWRNYDQAGSTINYGMIRVHFSLGTVNLRIGPIMIWYQRQISPAPASATFSDVPTDHWAFQFVEALVSAGITQGMPDGTYHPTDPVTRAQMATFLARALGLDYSDYLY